MLKLFLIGLAGGMGAIARYGLASFVQEILHARFPSVSFLPWGTAVVNVIGCFAFGLIWAVTEKHLTFTRDHRPYVLTGFMGSFTTFSTYIYDTGELMSNSQYVAAASNLAFQNVVGLAALAVGLAVGRWLSW